MLHRQLDAKLSVSIVFVASLFMSIMDGTIVNVALPSLGHQLAIPSTSIDEVVVAYLVSLAMVIPASGWLGDRWGTKRVFLFALALFTVASALCGLAANFTLLVIFRFLQGAVGRGMLCFQLRQSPGARVALRLSIDQRCQLLTAQVLRAAHCLRRSRHGSMRRIQ